MTLISRPTAPRSEITVLLLGVIILPAIVYFANLASSLALGTCIAAFILILKYMNPLIRSDFFHRNVFAYKSITPGALTLIVLGIIAIHGSIAAFILPVEIYHATLSMIPLSLIIVSGCALGEAIAAAPETDIDRAVKRCFVFFYIAAVPAVFGYGPPSPRESEKAVFPFNEPSHFALIFMPFFMFLCIRTNRWTRLGILILGYSTALLLENLTLLSGCFLVTLLCLRGFAAIPIIIVLAALGLVVVASELVDITYYLDRVNFSEDSQNLSTIIYIQGWQLIGESLAHSDGWGIGFQQLGLHGTEVEAADIIFGMVKGYGNVLDGGFTFAKIVSEFGVLGMLMICWFLLVASRSIRQIRKTATGVKISANYTFANCVIVSYLIELFERGAGYFTGTGVLVVASLWLLYTKRLAARSPERSAPTSRLSPA
jgi:hypothetical protein